jgi:hypothetical protein
MPYVMRTVNAKVPNRYSNQERIGANPIKFIRETQKYRFSKSIIKEENPLETQASVVMSEVPSGKSLGSEDNYGRRV